MTAMHKPSTDYFAIRDRLPSIARLILDARRMDQHEAVLVLSSNLVTSLPCTTEAAADMVKRDLDQAFSRANAAYSAGYLIVTSWLWKSRKSPDALGVGIENWSRAAEVSREAKEEMIAQDQAYRSRADWDSATSDGYVQYVKSQMMAQDRLIEALETVARSCETISITTKVLFDLVGAATREAEIKCSSGPVTRAASGATSLFALNSRTKAAARFMETFKNDLVQIQNNAMWEEISRQEATNIKRAVAILTEARPGPLNGPIAV